MHGYLWREDTCITIVIPAISNYELSNLSYVACQQIHEEGLPCGSSNMANKKKQHGTIIRMSDDEHKYLVTEKSGRMLCFTDDHVTCKQ